MRSETDPDRAGDGPRGDTAVPIAPPSSLHWLVRVLLWITGLAVTTFLFAAVGAGIGGWIGRNEETNWGPVFGVLYGAPVGAVAFVAFTGIRAARRSRDAGRWIALGVAATILVILVWTSLEN
jgi:hypothetical protein